MTTTHLNDLFDKLEPEKGNKLDRKIQVEEDKAMRGLIEKLYEIDLDKDIGHSFEYGYAYFSEIVSSTYSSDQITKFSNIITDRLIKETLGYNFGIFLNFLIRESPDESHELFLSHLDSNIACIGLLNKKNIIVNGNSDFPVCAYMREGTVVINGSVYELGFRMKGGKIIVNGDSCSVAGEIDGGDIYHKDKLIVKDGEILDRSYVK